MIGYSKMRIRWQYLLVWICLSPLAPTSGAADGSRVTQGLSVLYDFREESGQVIHDRSGVAPPLNLSIGNPDAVRWETDGLVIHRQTKIVSQRAATKIVAAVKRSGELTVEVWMQSKDLSQSGPARIVSLSGDATHRNFTLGQDRRKFDVRFRAAETSENGLPSTATPDNHVRKSLTHVLFTRNRAGETRIYIDGDQVVRKRNAGSLSNWDASFPLLLADEATGQRSWRGTLRLVAIYHRALTKAEVQKNFRVGAQADAAPQQASTRENWFARAAPILVEHCVECHDAPTRNGGLDLSHRTSALAGGDSGPSIQPGDPRDSFLMHTIESNDMPQNRPPLSAEEKEVLKQWIANGAHWGREYLDPVLYSHNAPAHQERWVQRLTAEEYVAAVQAAVGVDVSDVAGEILPADLRADGFSNTAYNLNVDLKHVEAYARLAEIAVQRMDVGQFAKRFDKSRKFTDKTMGKLIENMGRWILRGPIEAHEVIAYRGISTTVASAGGGYEEAVGLIVEAMLQSPKFIYRVENQRGDGTAWPVSDYELASRVSFIVWGSPPDQELFQAASDGALQQTAGLNRQLDRMLTDPRAAERARQFVSQWLNLDSLDNLRPNRERFPNWDPQLAQDMKRETLAFFEQVAWTEDRPIADLLVAQVTFATPELAKHYRLRAKPAPADARPTTTGGADLHSRLMRYDLQADPTRGGLLTQGSVLTIGGDNASMVTRGLFVLHDLLRGVVKDPPPCVDTTPVPTEPGLTQRMIANARIKNEACGGCHAKFEPLAFGLERFDGLGTYSEQDVHGNRLLDEGRVLFPGEADSVAYRSSAELMKLLAENQRVQESLTWKVTQFALGRPLTIEDATVIEKIHREAQANGGSYRSLLKEIIKSDLVQLTATEIDSASDAGFPKTTK